MPPRGPQPNGTRLDAVLRAGHVPHVNATYKTSSKDDDGRRQIDDPFVKAFSEVDANELRPIINAFKGTGAIKKVYSYWHIADSGDVLHLLETLIAICEKENRRLASLTTTNPMEVLEIQNYRISALKLKAMCIDLENRSRYMFLAPPATPFADLPSRLD